MKTTLYASLVLAHLALGSLCANRVPLHEAASKGDINQFFEIYNQCPQWINEQDYYGNTPLHVAAKKGHFALLEACVAKEIWTLVVNNANRTVTTYAFLSALRTHLEQSPFELKQEVCDAFYTLIEQLVANLEQNNGTFWQKALIDSWSTNYSPLIKFSETESRILAFVTEQATQQIQPFIAMDQQHVTWYVHCVGYTVGGTIATFAGLILLAVFAGSK